MLMWNWMPWDLAKPLYMSAGLHLHLRYGSHLQDHFPPTSSVPGQSLTSHHLSSHQDTNSLPTIQRLSPLTKTRATSGGFSFKNFSIVLRSNPQNDKLHYKVLSLILRKNINRQLVIFTMFQFRIEHVWPTPDKEAVAKAEPKWSRQRDLLKKG